MPVLTEIQPAKDFGARRNTTSSTWSSAAARLARSRGLNAKGGRRWAPARAMSATWPADAGDVVYARSARPGNDVSKTAPSGRPPGRSRRSGGKAAPAEDAAVRLDEVPGGLRVRVHIAEELVRLRILEGHRPQPTVRVPAEDPCHRAPAEPQVRRRGGPPAPPRERSPVGPPRNYLREIVAPAPGRVDRATGAATAGIESGFGNRVARPWTELEQARVIDVFDAVVVGGGSAGCVLASRLAGNPTGRSLFSRLGPTMARMGTAAGRTISSTATSSRWSRMTGGSRAAGMLHGEESSGWLLQPQRFRRRSSGTRRPCPLGGSSGEPRLGFRRANRDPRSGRGSQLRTGVPGFDALTALTTPPSWKRSRTSPALDPRGAQRARIRPGAARLPKKMAGAVRWNAAFAYLDPVSATAPNLRIRPEVLVDRVEFEGTRATAIVSRTATAEQRVRAGVVVARRARTCRW